MDSSYVPKINIPLDKGDVPLNQPFPKELSNVPIVVIAEQVGHTAIDSALDPDTAEAKVLLAKEQEVAKKQKHQTNNPSPIQKLVEQVKGAAVAIVKPEEGKKQDTKKKTSDPLVKILVIIGVVMISTGLIAFFKSAFLGIILMLIGALVIIFGVFAPIHAPKNA